MEFHFLLMELWHPAKAEGIPNVIRAEDVESTENVFSYEYEGSDLRVLLLSVCKVLFLQLRPSGWGWEDMGFSPDRLDVLLLMKRIPWLKPGVCSDANPQAKAMGLAVLLADNCCSDILQPRPSGWGWQIRIGFGL